MMAISRKELLKELLPGLNELFDIEYKRYDIERFQRNRQIHGLAEVEQRIFDRSYRTSPESHTQGSSV
jgi:hypothetical protein